MSTKEKLIKRFISQPKDFTWEELVRLFNVFGFSVDNKGKTSGSRVIFKKGIERIELHKPHPNNAIKTYKMKEVMDFLIKKGFIKLED